MTREFEDFEINEWRASLAPDRALVEATTVPMLYFIPAGMEENSDPSTETTNIGNVWAGLQQYQAQINTLEGSVPNDVKVEILSEIFSEPNDLIGLARIVEHQIGTQDVGLSLLKTHSWSTWQIKPALPDVTEGNWNYQHITLSITVDGTNLKAISKRKLVLDEVKKRLIEDQPELIVYTDSRDAGSRQIDFDLTSTDVSRDGSSIILNGVEGTRMEPNGPFPYIAYKFMRNGRMEVDEGRKISTIRDVLEVIEDDDLAQIHVLDRDTLQSLGVYNPGDWDSMRKLLKTEDEARKALLKFLLPYCDMPTEGRRYVLSEEHAKEMINRLGEEPAEVNVGGFIRL